MHADVPTLITSIMLASLIVALVMVVVGWGAPRDGLRLWAAAMTMHAAGYLFFGLRGRIDDTASILLGNGFTALSFAMLLAAVRRFYEVPRAWAGLLALPVLLMALLTTMLDRFDMRLLVANAIFGVQALAVVAALYRRRISTVGKGKWLVMAGLGFEAAVLAWRAGSGLSANAQLETLMQSSALQTVTFLGSFAVILMTSLGFVFMAKERADEANRIMAAADALTGIANRRAIIAALDRDVSRATRTREPIALMMMDLDHFKQINDTHGHRAGDAVLLAMARLVGQRIRSQDIVGRYGGEEFLVVLPDTTLTGAMRLAQDLCTAVASHPFKVRGQRVPLTVSIGVFGGRLESGDGWDALIHAADSALYRAKNAGRNRVEFTAQLPSSESRSGPDTFPAPEL